VSSPKIRRQGRARALEYLFGIEFTHNDWKAGLAPFWGKHEARPQVREYAEKLVEGVCTHKDELDAHIRDALTNWNWDRVDPVERSVLRIALYEMAYCGDVPPAVAINEAVEITHAYGGDESPRFVNGVLDKLKRVRVEQP
jgi:N utilization substance protein B